MSECAGGYAIGSGPCAKCGALPRDACRFPKPDPELARLRAANERLQAWEKAANEGHPSPCTLGPLCPYCEIDRQRAAIERKDKALQWIAARGCTNPYAEPCADRMPEGLWCPGCIAIAALPPLAGEGEKS